MARKPIPFVPWTRLIGKYTVVERTQCWLWAGAKNRNGYGVLYFDGKSYAAHRVSYVHFKGQIADDRELDHLCREPACVNPDHLEAVTHAENLRRAVPFSPEMQRRIATKKSYGTELDEALT